MAAHIERLSGIHITPSKHAMLEARLQRRLRALGMDDLAQYCQYLLSSECPGDEVVAMLDEVTTNKTDFFREPLHFNYLVEVALPELAGARMNGRQELQIWSAACSSGEEPYSLAITLSEFIGPRPSPRFTVLGTDLSTAMLAEAQRAVYAHARIEPVPRHLRFKYFMSSRDPAAHLVRVAPALRRTVRFRRLNLMDEPYQLGEPMDVVFCRNVLIYFDRKTQAAVVDRITRCMRAGSYLFVGHAESLQGMSVGLQLVAPTIYRKPG